MSTTAEHVHALIHARTQTRTLTHADSRAKFLSRIHKRANVCIMQAPGSFIFPLNKQVTRLGRVLRRETIVILSNNHFKLEPG